MLAVRTSTPTTGVRPVAGAGLKVGSKAVGQGAASTVQIGRMSRKMPATPALVRSGRGIRTGRLSHDDQRAREVVPAHDDTDVRTMFEGEEPRRDWGNRQGEDAFDSLVLSHETAADDPAHHTWAVHMGGPEVSWADSHGLEADSLDLALVSASPAAGRAHRKSREAAADTKAVPRRDLVWAPRFSDAGRRYGRAQKRKHEKRRG